MKGPEAGVRGCKGWRAWGAEAGGLGGLRTQARLSMPGGIAVTGNAGGGGGYTAAAIRSRTMSSTISEGVLWADSAFTRKYAGIEICLHLY